MILTLTKYYPALTSSKTSWLELYNVIVVIDNKSTLNVILITLSDIDLIMKSLISILNKTRKHLL